MVSIIILSYNRSDLLKECLSSIYNNVKNNFEVIVVDNASSDDSIEVVKKNFKKVKLIQNNENAGFAKGCNIGAKNATGEYLLFLNSDAELENDPLPALLKTFDENKDAGIVGGLLLNHDNTLQRSFGNFYFIKNIFILLFRGEKGELERYKSSITLKTDWVSGGFMMVNKEVFQSVGGFNESYFMYIEDMDLCYRVKKIGKCVYVNPHAKVKHLGQGSSNKTFAIVHIFEGLQIFYKQQRSIYEYYVVKCMLAIKGIASLLIGVLTFNKYLIRTYIGALKTL
ncbi:MAG: glycosyltransferase family 2 protein [Candidatus Levybacteria bacterium]|nr:glycosyltransferase family 2 protein [Candidatus Levybacteria bacterium]